MGRLRSAVNVPGAPETPCSKAPLNVNPGPLPRAGLGRPEFPASRAEVWWGEWMAHADRGAPFQPGQVAGAGGAPRIGATPN